MVGSGRTRRWVAGAAAAMGLVTGCVPPGTPPPSYGISLVVEGIGRAWDLAFAPDGTLLFTERGGAVRALVDGTPVTLGVPADAVASGEGGMMGLAVDPDFATNRRIYTCFLSNASGALDVRIVRWEVEGPDWASAAVGKRADLVAGMPVSATQPGRHSGCRLRFGPDGFLWATTGDAVTATAPQDPASLGGKVLRVTTDGEAAPGNPGGALDPRIYSLGHRNPQGVSFRPGDGAPFSVEHGTGCDDEVNALVPGGNYGWDPVGGSGNYDESLPMTDRSIPGAIPATWSSGCPTIAPSGATFISGAEWGAWDGALAMAVLKGSQLRVLQLDAAGATVVEQWISFTDYGRVRVAVQGPDGDLYVALDRDPGTILRLTPPR